jgi:RHS repeat-associated protein
VTAIAYPDGRRLQYGYDAAGNRTSLTAKVGATTLATTYGYDALDRISNVTDPGSRVFGQEYDEVGNLSKLVRPNGVDTKYTHNSLNRLTNIRTYARTPDTTIASYGYTLGPTGIRTKIEEADGTTRSYEYDDLYRLTKETVTGAQAYEKSFAYDAVSNRTKQTSSGAVVDAGEVDAAATDGGVGSGGTTNYSYDNRDRLLSENGTVYSWSANGNLVGRSGEATYEWDFEDRLVKVTKSDGTVVENVYDVDGVLVRTAVNGVGTDLLVDTSGGLSHVVAEIDGSGTVTAVYVRARGMLLEEIRVGVAKMYEADGLGSTRSLLDGAGATTDTYAFTAFGENLTNTGTDANPYRFAGERFVEAAGMYQNRARWLDTRTGRFVSYDHGPPTGYKYAHDDPVNYRDPSGYFEWNAASITLTVAAVAVVGAVMYGYYQGPVNALANHAYNTSIVSGLTPVKHQQLLASFKPYAEVYSDPDFDRGVAKGIRWFWKQERIHNLYWAAMSAKAYRNAGYEMSQDLRLCSVERYLDGLGQSQPGWHMRQYPRWQASAYDAVKWAGGENLLEGQGFYPPSPYSSNAKDWYWQGRSGIGGQFNGVVPGLRCWRWTDTNDENPFNFATGEPVNDTSVPEPGCGAP